MNIINQTLNFDQEQLQTQIDTLVAEIKNKTQSNVIDGIIEEIATNRLIYQEIVKKIDILDSQLTINNIGLPIDVPQQVVDELVISADFPLSADNGFYQLEYDARGKTMRWTGLSNSFGFDLCFDRTKDKIIILEILSPLSEKNIPEMKCFVDHRETPLSIAKKDGICQLTASLAANNQLSNTKISYQIPELIRPCDINPNQKDERNLGVAFYQLSIKNVSQNHQ